MSEPISPSPNAPPSRGPAPPQPPSWYRWLPLMGLGCDRDELISHMEDE